MKKTAIIFLLILVSVQLFGQKISYKSGVLNTDGKDIARIVRIKDKESFGLTGIYELYTISGVKLIIATLASDYVPDRNDNGSYYYRFTFLTTNQTGIFSLSKFGPEKSFAKLIGESGIIDNDSLKRQKVSELIALKSKNPEVATVKTELYSMTDRYRAGYVELNTDQTISQARTTIGKFKDVSQYDGLDVYEFSIPQGLVIATVSFREGKKSTHFVVHTLKDNYNLEITIPVGNSTIMVSSVDRNESALLRITHWLIDHNYL